MMYKVKRYILMPVMIIISVLFKSCEKDVSTSPSEDPPVANGFVFIN